MKRLRPAALGMILVATATGLNAQIGSKAPSSIRVHDFRIKDRTAPKILSKLAKTYRIVIGVYGSGTFSFVDMPAPIDVDIKSGTLADVFDTIAAADQQFSWSQGNNGAVHFMLRASPLSLMDVKVHSFDYENPQWPQITARLRTVPEIYGWLQAHKCSMPDQTVRMLGRAPKAWSRFSVHATDLPVSSILDQVAAKSGTYYWHAIQVTTPEPCVVTIQWWL
jgi:hypothetical protein